MRRLDYLQCTLPTLPYLKVPTVSPSRSRLESQDTRPEAGARLKEGEGIQTFRSKGLHTTSILKRGSRLLQIDQRSTSSMATISPAMHASALARLASC